MVPSLRLLQCMPVPVPLRRRLVAVPFSLSRKSGLFTTSPAYNDVRQQQQQQQQQQLTDKRILPSNKPSNFQSKLASRSATQDKITVHEDIYTIPNILTFTRLVAAPVVGYLVLQDAHVWAVGLLAYAGVTDLLDGWIARRWNCRTVVGTVIDPMADKILMTILTVCLAVKGALPVWVATIILGRDVGLAISAIYYRWISLPPPKTFARYWDFSLPSAEVRPTTISKYNTFLQLALVGLTTAAPIIAVDMAPALTIMQYVVAATTVWSGASYVYTKDAVKILNKPKP
ncbi:putative cardiolipin synthase (CMP-forming) [Cladobotryum mycophilum]|uniref:Cardiolipin synthase (CMP-forming) n=1 Tax=Cladobotryum mycophilum TaxID=491253 RepID=A0ABR0SZI2_9HYPO